MMTSGYRALSQDEIDLINDLKAQGEELGALVESLKHLDRSLKHLNRLDQRWVAIGKTALQKGVMALVRAVAQPTTF